MISHNEWMTSTLQSKTSTRRRETLLKRIINRYTSRHICFPADNYSATRVSPAEISHSKTLSFQHPKNDTFYYGLNHSPSPYSCHCIIHKAFLLNVNVISSFVSINNRIKKKGKLCWHLSATKCKQLLWVAGFSPGVVVWTSKDKCVASLPCFPQQQPIWVQLGQHVNIPTGVFSLHDSWKAFSIYSDEKSRQRKKSTK